MAQSNKEINPLDDLFKSNLANHEKAMPDNLASWSRMTDLLEAEERKNVVPFNTRLWLYVGIAIAASVSIAIGVRFAMQTSNAVVEPVAMVTDEESAPSKVTKKTTTERTLIDSAKTDAPASLPQKVVGNKKLKAKRKTAPSAAKALMQGVYLAEVIDADTDNTTLATIETGNPENIVVTSILNSEDSFVPVEVRFLSGTITPLIEIQTEAVPLGTRIGKFFRRLWNIKEGKESLNISTEKLYAIFDQGIEENTENNQ